MRRKWARVLTPPGLCPIPQNPDLFTGYLNPLYRDKEGSAGAMSLEFGNNHFSGIKMPTTCNYPARTSSHPSNVHAHKF